MTRNKGNNGGGRVHFISLPCIWKRDASAMHTTFQGTQYTKITDLLKKELSSIVR